MKREVEFNPVKVVVLGVKVYCANDQIATDLLLKIKAQNLSINGATKEAQVYAYSAENATKQFLKVYNEITNRA